MSEPSRALALLNRVIDAHVAVHDGKRESIAADLGVSFGTFSKMTTGVNAFGLASFELLDRDIQQAWVTQYGKEIGLDVRPVSDVELAREIIQRFSEMVDSVQRSRKLLDIGKPTPLKAELPSARDARKVG